MSSPKEGIDATLKISVSRRPGEGVVGRLRRVRGWQHLHLDAELAQPSQQPVGERGGLLAVQIIRAEFAIGLALRDHVVGDDQEPVGHRHDGALRAAAGGDAPIAGRQRGALRPRGPVRRLDQRGLQPRVPLAGLAGALAAAALVIARRLCWLPWSSVPIRARLCIRYAGASLV